ncbi:MAG: hypothetical protein J7L42_02210 [Elusimicrobia bacterium]|nr:hypothetical protein [Elusimicrobiota bacterium]
MQTEIKEKIQKKEKVMKKIFLFIVFLSSAFALQKNLIERGKKLFHEKRYREAYLLFSQATRELPTSPLAWYNLAITGYKLKLYKESAENFAKAAQLSAKIKPQALYYRAMCLWKLKEYLLAEKFFAEVIKISPYSRYGWASRKNLRILTARRKRWTIFLSLSGKYDDNVNYEPVSVDVSQRDKDYMLDVIFSGKYRFFKRLLFGYSFFGTKYREFSNLDFVQHTGKFSIPLSLSEKIYSELKARYWISQLDREDYQKGFKISENFSFGKNTEFLLSFSNKDYVKESYSYLDARVYGLSIVQNFKISRWKTSLNCSYKKQDAKDSSGVEESYTYYTSPTTSTVATTPFFRSYSFNGYKADIKTRGKVFGNVSINIGVSYTLNRYKDKDSWYEKKIYYKDSNDNWYEIITTTYTYLEPTDEPSAKEKLRKDKIFSFRLSLTKPISKHFSLVAEYFYTDTRSTIDEDDYRDRNYKRGVFSVSLNMFF